MADIPHSHSPAPKNIPVVWLCIAAIPVVVGLFDPSAAVPTLSFAANAIAHTGLFIIFAVLSVGYLKATGAETLLARAFEGPQTRMIVMAALLGGLSPFCSCEVIPFVAALLAMGAPLSAVMAFWLASPLMDPAMFLITASALGWDFAMAKALAAIALGMFGGLSVMALSRTALFTDPLRSTPHGAGCCGGTKPFQGKPLWVFWSDPARRTVFADTVRQNALFLFKWLLLAYLIEAVMVRYIPAQSIAAWLGGTGFSGVLMGALVGMPAYLNGYAAVPLVSGLLAQGMSQGAAMSFVLAGGVSCIPAAIAVWALVKPRIFAAYLGLALAGSVLAGLIWQMVSG